MNTPPKNLYIQFVVFIPCIRRSVKSVIHIVCAENRQALKINRNSIKRNRLEFPFNLICRVDFAMSFVGVYKFFDHQRVSPCCDFRMGPYTCTSSCTIHVYTHQYYPLVLNDVFFFCFFLPIRHILVWFGLLACVLTAVGGGYGENSVHRANCAHVQYILEGRAKKNTHQMKSEIR